MHPEYRYELSRASIFALSISEARNGASKRSSLLLIENLPILGNDQDERRGRKEAPSLG